MNLLDHGAADTLGSIGAIMSGPQSRIPVAFRCAALDGYGVAGRLCGCRAIAAQARASGSYYRIAWRSLCRCDQSVGDLLIEFFRHRSHTFVAILTKESGRKVVFESCSASPVFVEDDP